MRFLPGAITLDQIAGGVLQSGTIPWPRLTIQEIVAKNSGAVTLTAAETVIATNGQISVAVGDRILIEAICTASKGITTGNTSFTIRQDSGTATIRFVDDGVNPVHSFLSHPAGQAWDTVMSVLWEVTGAGTLVMRLSGTSAGSDSTIAAERAGFRMVVFPAP